MGAEDPLEKEKASHSTVLAWEIPQTQQAIIHRVTRVGRDLVTKTSAGLVHGYFQVTNYQNMCLRFVHLVYIFQEEFYEIKYVAPFAIGVELWTV